MTDMRTPCPFNTSISLIDKCRHKECHYNSNGCTLFHNPTQLEKVLELDTLLDEYDIAILLRKPFSEIKSDLYSDLKRVQGIMALSQEHSRYLEKGKEFRDNCCPMCDAPFGVICTTMGNKRCRNATRIIEDLQYSWVVSNLETVTHCKVDRPFLWYFLLEREEIESDSELRLNISELFELTERSTSRLRKWGILEEGE